MKCITYGFMVLVLTIMTMALFMILGTQDIYKDENGVFHIAPVKTAIWGGGLIILVSIGLTIWWIGGFFSKCEDGFVASNLRK